MDADAIDSMVIDVANAMRLVSHNARLPATVFSREGATSTMRSIQCVARIENSRPGLLLRVDPFMGIADGFEQVEIRLPRSSFPGSPLLDDVHDGPAGAFGTFASLFDPIQDGGVAKGFVHDGRAHALLHAPRDAEREEKLALLDNLIRGTDAMSGGEVRMLVRHPAFGTAASADPVDASGAVRSLPDTVEGTPMAAQVERIRMIRLWARELPDAVVAAPLRDRIYQLAPLTYTYSDAEDPSSARRGAVAAYARLHAYGDGSR